MNSRDYWAQREEEALRNYIRDEAEYDRQIRRIYTDMLDACQRDIESFYSRYAGAEGITIAEAKKRVSQADIKAYERKAAKYVREKNFSKQANEEMRLYNATMRINRMEMLRANIGLELIAGHDELNNFMGEILQGRTMEEMKRMSGILGKTVLHNTKKAAAIVNGSFHNGTFSDRIWQYQDLMREDLGKLLQQGLIQGKNPRALTKDLRKYLLGDKVGKGATYNVERLMRTELCRVQTEAQKQSYERNGFELYRFICNVHPSKSDTCDICKRIAARDNGNGAGIYLVKDMMPGLNAPPMHPNCRCGTAEAVESEEEHEAWLDWLESGGTQAEWEATGRAAWKAKQKSGKLMGKEQGDEVVRNDWSKTTPRTVPKATKRELVEYAALRGINIHTLDKFDGDPELLRSTIDTLYEVSQTYPTGKRLAFNVSVFHDDNDFGETEDASIKINLKALRDREITEENIALGGRFASRRVEDIVAHEYGHVVCAAKGNKGLALAMKAYYNVFGEEIGVEEMWRYLRRNVSRYSTTIRHDKYTEVTSEMLAMNNSHSNAFTAEFSRLLQEDCKK